VNWGEPGLQTNYASVHQAVDDKLRFNDKLAPSQDLFKENSAFCFLSPRDSKILNQPASNGKAAHGRYDPFARNMLPIPRQPFS